MRIGIVSDIHCNAAGLLAALNGMGDIDALVCSGDTVYQYRFSNEVLAILRRYGAHLVLGNHDAVVLSRDGVRVRESGNATEENLELLRQAPLELRLTLDGKRIYVVHGSPWAPLKEYLFTTSPNFRRLAEIERARKAASGSRSGTSATSASTGPVARGSRSRQTGGSSTGSRGWERATRASRSPRTTWSRAEGTSCSSRASSISLAPGRPRRPRQREPRRARLAGRGPRPR